MAALLVAGAFLAGLLAPSAALADKKLAKRMLKEATALLKKGETDSAIARLSSAWELVPSAKIAKTLVSAYDKKGDAGSAAKFVETIVAAKKPKKLVRWAKKKRKAYAKTLKKLGAAKAAQAAAADKAAADQAAKQAKAGAEAKRLAQEEAKAKADARSKQKVKAPAKKAKAPAKKAEAKKAPAKKKKEEEAKKADAAPVDPDFDEDMESSYVPPPDPTWTFFGYTAAGIAIASLGTGTFFLLRKNGKQQEANDCAADADITGGKCAQATYNNLTDEMDSAFTLELASWATAVFAAGASITLFALAPPAELSATSATPTWRLLVGPTGGLLSGSF